MNRVSSIREPDDWDKVVLLPKGLILEDYEFNIDHPLLIIIAHLKSWSRNKTYKIKADTFGDWLEENYDDLGDVTELFAYCNPRIVTNILDEFIKTKSFRNGATY